MAEQNINALRENLKKKVLFIEENIDLVRAAMDKVENGADYKCGEAQALVEMLRDEFPYSDNTTNYDIFWQIETTYLRMYTTKFERCRSVKRHEWKASMK